MNAFLKRLNDAISCALSKHVNLIFGLLIAVLLLDFGCAKQDKIPDEVKGWTMCHDQDPRQLSEAIRADYNEYIQKLPKSAFVSTVNILEDGNGRHAVNIEVGQNGAYWEHFIIYDTNSNRIKVIKYANGYYRS